MTEEETKGRLTSEESPKERDRETETFEPPSYWLTASDEEHYGKKPLFEGFFGPRTYRTPLTH